MLLQLRRIFRRVAKRPIFFTANCDKSELQLWHSLADVSDYLGTLSKEERAQKKADIFNELAENHGWPVGEEGSRVKMWLDGMFEGAHHILPNEQYSRHTRFLARDKYDEMKTDIDPELWTNGRDFVLGNHYDIRSALKLTQS